MEVIEKVQKLFALAGNNPNEHEAYAALLKARAMMAEHGLNDQDVAGAVSGPARSENRVLSSHPRKVPIWEVSLDTIVAEAFRCVVYQSQWQYGHMIRAVGLPEDLDMVDRVLSFAKNAAASCLQDYARQVGQKLNRQQINGYYIGFGQGLKRAFKAQEESHPEWALALMTHPVVQDAVTNLNLHASRKRHVSYSTQAAVQGDRDGYDVGKQHAAPRRPESLVIHR